jgi:hypothetical protein
MIKYGDLVQYIKDNHINWNTNLFDVLEGFFEEYSQSSLPTSPHQCEEVYPLQQELAFPLQQDWQPPPDGEYSPQDVLNLFSR